jgi:ABC-type amino acid transport substrate-binding protein
MPLIRIFVSSPGDCERERNVLEEVLDSINRSDRDRTGITLASFRWEVNVVSRIGLPPQEVVDDQTPLCDIYLGIMSSRFGGDGARESGTESEFRLALKQFTSLKRPWVLFYFNEAPPRAKSAAAAKQLARVFKFREELEKLGIVGRYSSVRGNPRGFFETVGRDLRTLLNHPDLLRSTGSSGTAAAVDEGDRAGASPAPARRRSRLDVVKSTKRLRCGAVRHAPLSDYQFTDDRRAVFSGFYVELARDVGARNGMQVDLLPIQWHEFTSDIFAIPPADPRAVDLVLSVFETYNRREYADFTCNFHRIDLCAVVRTDSAIRTLSELHDTRLSWAVADGEAGWEYAARELRIEPYDTVVLRHPDIGTALNVLVSGGADVAVVDRLTFDRFLAVHPEAPLRTLDERVWEFRNGIMIPRQDRRFEDWVREEFCASRKVPAIAELERQVLAECKGAVRRYA